MTKAWCRAWTVVACVLLAPAGGRAQEAATRIDRLIAEADRLASQQVRRADLSLPVYRDAVALADREGESERAARARIMLGRALFNVHQTGESRRVLEQASSLASRIRSPALESLALRYLSFLEVEEGNYAGADRTLARSTELAKLAGDVRYEIGALNSRSVVNRRQGRLAMAQGYAEHALRLVDAALAEGRPLDSDALFAVPFNVGKALAESGDFSEAIVYLDRAFEAATRTGNHGGQWHALHDSAEWYQAQGDSGRAARYHERALELGRKAEARDMEAHSLRGLGIVAETRGDHTEAIARYSAAAGLYERIGMTAEIPKTLVALSRVEADAGRHLEARHSIERALAQARRFNQSSGLARAYLERARQRARTGRHAAAAEDYEAALKIAREAGLRPLVPVALAGLARAARDLADPQQAVERYWQSGLAIESLRTHIGPMDQRSAFAAATHATYAGLIETWLDLDRETPGAGSRYQAFLALERERTQNLEQALNDASVDRSRTVPAERRERQRQLHRRVAELQTRLMNDQVGRAGHSQLLAELDDAERALASVESERAAPERDEEPSTLGAPSDAPAAPVSASEARTEVAILQRTLRPGEALIAYALDRFAFVVTRDRFDLVPLEPPVALGDRITFFMAALADSNADAARRSGAPLARALVAPVLAVLPRGTGSLLIGASGALAGLSFAALPVATPAGDGALRPLVASYAVAHVPSLSALARLRSPRRKASRQLLAVANPDLPGAEPEGELAAILRGPRLAPLPFSEEEISAVSRHATASWLLLKGSGATEAALKRLSLAEYQTLHFATHAILDSDHPSRSAMVLAPGSDNEDGLLQPREIYDLELSADLVVLSACRTASGRVSNAEGMDSLARAFMYAGARAVVGTLWDVDDRATARVMERYYAELADDASGGAALRAAQLRNAGDRPYDTAGSWAGFVIAGDPLARPDLSPAPWPGRIPPLWILIAVPVGLTGVVVIRLAARRRAPCTR
jgi:CHAT domain-containing protein/tetratricopeptide (TPR) repeat protein